MQNFPDDALLVQESHSLIHSFFYYSYIVSFHLISSHLQGDNNKNKLLKMQCIIYSLFFTLFKHFSGFGLARKGKKT